MDRFSGKVCLVTGAAGGIGSAIAARLVAEGGTVVAVDRDAAALEALAQRLDAGPSLVVRRVDLARLDEAAEVVEETARRLGRFDVLCNNHAETDPSVLLHDSDVVSTSIETWRHTLEINLLAPVATCKAAIPHMQRQGGGAIVNTVSISGVTGDLIYSAYGASKAALLSLTQYIATQYGKDEIRANAVAPGMVMTPGATGKVDPADIERIVASNLVPRVGEPADIAGTVAFLASDDARYVTGELVRADGGLMSHISSYATLRGQ
jgi:NAD(P)-dependent dehydrogenase (short-subunit alcohol dehydrogenase family)